MLVAGHRGVRVGAPENTMEAFLMAAKAGVDMIETDTHMTKDGVIILMHDHTIDRTTSGTGLIQEAVGFAPKSAARGGGQVLYFKHSDLISDYLTYLGAHIAAMGIMEAKLEKELNNNVNRRCNCDDANISKVVEAAQEQLAAIRVLRERNCYDHLPEKIKQAADAREKNPEASLTELAAMMAPPITKPAMNHRLKKLVKIAQEAEK